MTDKLDDVWTTRDWPVLLEVARRIDQGEQFVSPQSVADATGLDLEQVGRASVALQRRGLVETLSSWAEQTDADFSGISGEAYLMTGLHPSGDDALSSLVDALRQAADLEQDPDEKTRLRIAADGLLNVSRGIATSVVTAWITKQVGAG